MSGHTPGPAPAYTPTEEDRASYAWRFGSLVMCARMFLLGSMDRPSFVREVNKEHDSALFPSIPEHADDDCLFAAAPDLLARVKARFAWCDCGSARVGIAVCDDCKADSAAIAKAEGRAK